MARPKNHPCAACSRTSVERAQEKECWEGQPCHNRRSYYRHRSSRNSDRRLRYRFKKSSAVQTDRSLTITVTPPQVSKPIAIAVVYSPPTGGTHAIAFEVWQDSKRVAVIEAVHCQGWSNLDLAAHTQNVLGEMHKRFGITAFASRKTLPARECPVNNCPLARVD